MEGARCSAWACVGCISHAAWRAQKELSKLSARSISVKRQITYVQLVLGRATGNKEGTPCCTSVPFNSTQLLDDGDSNGFILDVSCCV